MAFMTFEEWDGTRLTANTDHISSLEEGTRSVVECFRHSYAPGIPSPPFEFDEPSYTTWRRNPLTLLTTVNRCSYLVKGDVHDLTCIARGT